jgi:hypothetical protein
MPKIYVNFAQIEEDYFINNSLLIRSFEKFVDLFKFSDIINKV